LKSTGEIALNPTNYALNLHQPENAAILLLPKASSKAERLRQAAIEDRLFDTRHWRSSVALSLSLKQAFQIRPKSLLRATLDEQKAKSAFGHFMHRMNRSIYKNAFERYGKRLRVIGVLEKAEVGRWNYHAAIELPTHLTPEQFETLIRNCWSGMHWGYCKMKIEFDADQTWVNYMLKPWQKSGLEVWADAIDLEHLYNPIADA
jgi:hypothetical protein